MSGPAAVPAASWRDVFCLAGPTASGKSAVALPLATRLNAEIISVDSMQVYQGLDLGTAKPAAAERARVAHHLVDVVGLEETFDAARFVELAGRAVEEIRGRGRRVLLCGGTGLYFKAFLEGLGEAPPADRALRVVLEGLPTEELLAELAARDPATLAKFDRQNRRRLIRALEVCRLTGRPFSSLRAGWTDAASSGSGAQPPFFALRRAPEDLRRRIEARVDEMFALGLVEETRGLLAKLAANPTAAQALGYRQVMEHLRGEHALASTIQRVKTRTWQFARRQSTWFRYQLPVHWIDCEPHEAADQVAGRILSSITARSSAATRA